MKFKKLVSMALGAAMMMFVLAGCAASSPEQPVGPDEPDAQLANPWVDCATLAEAETLAGFTFQLPFDTIPGDVFRAMEGEMIEVISTVGGSITARKGLGEEDISGDYISYAWTGDADGVTLKGFSADEVVLATWHKDGYSYSLSYGEPLTKDQMMQAVAATA